MQRRNVWIVALPFFWFLVGLVLLFARQIEGQEFWGAGTGYLLLGIVSSIFLLALLKRDTAGVVNISIISGYFLATPVAYFFSLAGLSFLTTFADLTVSQEFLVQAFASVLVFFWGSLPLIIGSLLGGLFGRLLEKLFRY